MEAYEILRDKGVSRLCHFTKLQKFVHIVSSSNGILSSDSIRSDIKEMTDKQRYDGELEYICCSIEYPNSWFLKNAMQRNTNPVFREWIVLYIDMDILKQRELKFCPCNAAKDHGRYIFEDVGNLESLFAQKTILGRIRPECMLQCCPTDGQAEILIRKNIPRDFITGVVAANEEIASQVYSILKTIGVSGISIYVAPDIVTTDWSAMVRAGRIPYEWIFDVERGM